MPYWAWSYLLTAVGVTGFLLAGGKVWWAWYVNLACQGLWMAYALATGQYGFIVASAIYTVVFTKNALAWTREHRSKDAAVATPPSLLPQVHYEAHLDPNFRITALEWRPTYDDWGIEEVEAEGVGETKVGTEFWISRHVLERFGHPAYLPVGMVVTEVTYGTGGSVISWRGRDFTSYMLRNTLPEDLAKDV